MRLRARRNEDRISTSVIPGSWYGNDVAIPSGTEELAVRAIHGMPLTQFLSVGFS
jgi:hypothetical protein